MENKPFTTAFVDGNHDNHSRLAKYPVKKWYGGNVHEIRPHVLHLMRGEIFTINCKTFFTFGGASSHDIRDGILDCKDPEWKAKAKELEKQYKYYYRVKGLTWWEEELPSEEEMQHGLDTLKQHGNQVDYILTHSPSASVVAMMGHGAYQQDILTQYLEGIRCNIKYQKWLFGHMHVDRAVNNDDICLYEQIVQIN